MYSLWLISSVTLVQFQWPTVSTLVSRRVLSCGMAWNSLCSGMLKSLFGKETWEWLANLLSFDWSLI